MILEQKYHNSPLFSPPHPVNWHDPLTLYHSWISLCQLYVLRVCINFVSLLFNQPSPLMAGRSTTVHWTAWHVLHRWIWNIDKNGIYDYFIAYVPGILAYHKYPLCVLFVKRESKGQTSAHSSGGWWIQIRCVVLVNPGISPQSTSCVCRLFF